ncbi:hypothetical protein NUW58_g3889 [Xylaria curta]|uniref:Uncharacterized protein n=1 Tax=Xylaria curta TaxID=42375 RepID=A0ACC1PA61_9PEZI|nr:hypothetical protein NUW58_g3889 [Xylaria curta]
MANPSRLDLPIALRRTPRRCVSAAAAPPTHLRVVSAPVPAILKTPSKSRPKKRVRFSDPGISLAHHEEANTLHSTGLTPMIKRSSLSGLAAKRRRGPAAQGPASAGDLQNEESTDEIDVLSLPQTLGDRAQRRIGETSTTPKRKAKTSTRKENATTAKIEAEVQRLRTELANRDAEIERLHSETLVHDTERIVELEQQLETLRAELAQQQQLPRSQGWRRRRECRRERWRQ